MDNEDCTRVKDESFFIVMQEREILSRNLNRIGSLGRIICIALENDWPSNVILEKSSARLQTC